MGDAVCGLTFTVRIELLCFVPKTTLNFFRTQTSSPICPFKGIYPELPGTVFGFDLCLFSEIDMSVVGSSVCCRALYSSDAIDSQSGRQSAVTLNFCASGKFLSGSTVAHFQCARMPHK